MIVWMCHSAIFLSANQNSCYLSGFTIQKRGSGRIAREDSSQAVQKDSPSHCSPPCIGYASLFCSAVSSPDTSAPQAFRPGGKEDGDECQKVIRPLQLSG